MRKSPLFMINKDLMMENEGSEAAFYGKKYQVWTLENAIAKK